MEFLVYLSIIPEVPRGFEREPMVQISELNMADDLLAADIVAVENAAATTNEVHADTATAAAAAAEPEREAAATAGIADVAMTDVDKAAAEAGQQPAAAAGVADVVMNGDEKAAKEAGAVAAEAAGVADVAMTDAKGSAEAGKQADLADSAQDASGAEAAAAEAPLVQATTQNAVGASDAPPKSAEKQTTISADATQETVDMVVDSNGNHCVSSYSNGLHPAQANGVEHSLPGPGASGPEHSDDTACNGTSKALPSSTAPSSANPQAQPTTADTVALLANGHAKSGFTGEGVRPEGDPASPDNGFADPNAIDICEDGEIPHHQNIKPVPPQPKQKLQELIQSGYPCQSGYGDIDGSEYDSDQSDSANTEELGVADAEEELYIPVPPSPDRPEQPMDTDPPAGATATAPAGAIATAPVGVAAAAPAGATATALELPNGVDPSASHGNPAAAEGKGADPPADTPAWGSVKIKIEPGLDANAAAGADQNQIQMDAMAFLAVNDEESEDDLPRARPRRGQVSPLALPFLPVDNVSPLYSARTSASRCPVVQQLQPKLT